MSNTKLHILYLSLLIIMIFLFVTDRYIPLFGIIVWIIGNSKKNSLYIVYIKNIPSFLYKNKIVFLLFFILIASMVIYLLTLNCICKTKGNDNNITISIKSMDEKVATIYHLNGNIGGEMYFTKYFIPKAIKLYYENGNLAEKRNILNLKIEGLREVYYITKKLKSKTFYENGELEGKYTLYYKNGAIQEEGFYKKGLQQNLKTVYYKNGTISQTTNYKNNKKHGEEKIYNTNEQLIEENYYKHGIMTLR